MPINNIIIKSNAYKPMRPAKRTREMLECKKNRHSCRPVRRTHEGRRGCSRCRLRMRCGSNGVARAQPARLPHALGRGVLRRPVGQRSLGRPAARRGASDALPVWVGGDAIWRAFGACRLSLHVRRLGFAVIRPAGVASSGERMFRFHGKTPGRWCGSRPGTAPCGRFTAEAAAGRRRTAAAARRPAAGRPARRCRPVPGGGRRRRWPRGLRSSSG